MSSSRSQLVVGEILRFDVVFAFQIGHCLLTFNPNVNHRGHREHERVKT